MNRPTLRSSLQEPCEPATSGDAPAPDYRSVLFGSQNIELKSTDFVEPESGEVGVDDPDESDHDTDDSSGTGCLPRAKKNLEAVMGLLAAFFIGIPVPVVAAGAASQIPWPDASVPLVLSLSVFLATGYLCVTVVRLASRAIDGEFEGRSFRLTDPLPNPRRNDELYIPLSLAMAIRLPNWWVGIRPLIALWWAGHFLVAAIFGHMAAKQLNGVNNAALVTIPLMLALTMAFLLAANLYLMLAIAVGIPRPRVWLVAWKFRFAIDLVITLFMIFAA